MTEQVTRCPSCDTSFVVSEAQLSAADGAVRCGACLEVFMAADYFLEAPIADLFDGYVEPDAEVETGLELKQEVSETPSEDAPSEFETSEPQVSDSEELPSSELQSPESESGETQVSDSQAIDPPDVLVQEQVKAEGEPVDEEQVPGETTHLDADECAAGDGEIEQVSQGESHLDEVDPDQLDQALQQITDEPLENLVPDAHHTHPRNNGRWFALALMLLVLLAGQHFWFERNHYAAQMEYRVYYQKLCNALGCELEPFSDVAYLKTNNLVVRTHPTQDKGLVVDALLRNEAGLRQPFPGLYLRFADINGETLAERTFQPGAYLAGEMAGLKFIPAATEVRLSMEILDPGAEAVSYSLVAVALP